MAQEHWIEVFRTGTHTDSAGGTREWTEADLDRMAGSYDPARHEAPVVVGHPAHDAPAYGWVRGLKRVGQLLLAKVGQMAPEFVEAVRAGQYKKRSIALYPDGTLRHLAFLGAQPPAVKGLKDVQFGAAAGQTLELVGAFADADLGLGLTVPQGGRVESPADAGWATPARVPRGSGRQGLGAAWGAPGTDYGLGPQFGAGLPDKSGASEPVLRVQQLEQQVAAMQRERDQDRWRQFAEALVTQGRLLPCQMGPVLALMEPLAQVSGALRFSDGQGGQQSRPALTLFQEFLATLPPQVSYGEFATSDRAMPGNRGGGQVADIARAVGEVVEAERKAGRPMSYAEALAVVQRDLASNPPLGR